MANNTYVNKVQLADGTVLLDISSDTVSAADVSVGVTFHLPTGQQSVGTVVDGDELEYGTARLTDLAGTTWLFNDVITKDTFDYRWQYGNVFSCNGVNHSSLRWSANSFYYNNTEAYYDLSGWGWFDNAYKTITFLQTSPVSVETGLINYMYANATRIS